MSGNSPDAPAGRSIRLHLCAWVILAAVGAALFAQSYQRWGHPVIDLGRDLYVPGRLLAGEVLYRDITYNYGPLAPYLLAAVTGVLGNSLPVFATVGIACGIAAMAALYAIGLRLSGIGAAFAGALLFLMGNFFAHSTWGCNFVLPYSYAATFGITFALWSFYLLLRHLADGGRLSICLSVAFLLLAVLSKQEVGLAILLVHVTAWLTRQVSWRAIATTVACGIVVALICLGLFAAHAPGDHELLRDNLARFSANEAARSFFRRIAGLDRPASRLADMVLAVAQLLAILVATNLACAVPGLKRRKRWGTLSLAVLAALPAAWFLWLVAEPRVFAAAAPLAAILFVAFLIRDRRDPLLLLSAFVLFTALRIPLRYTPLWYGFALSVPVYPFVVYGLGVRLPRHLPFPRVSVAVVCVIAALTLGRLELRSLERHRAMSSRLDTPKGTMRDLPIGRAEAIEEFLLYMRTRRGSETTLVAFPEGVSLNYFSGIPNPTGDYLFIPPEVPTDEAARLMVARLEMTPPDFVVITSRDVGEFGSRGFGVDYALPLREWISTHYRVERVFQPGGKNSWRLALLSRTDGASRSP